MNICHPPRVRYLVLSEVTTNPRWSAPITSASVCPRSFTVGLARSSSRRRRRADGFHRDQLLDEQLSEQREKTATMKRLQLGRWLSERRCPRERSSVP